MPKKNGAGKCEVCCCKPITERVDELDSFWQCWLGQPYGSAVGGTPPADYSGLSSIGNVSFIKPHAGWVVSGGQLTFSKTVTTTVGGDAPLCADAVRLPIPYSMEMIVDVDAINIVPGFESQGYHGYIQMRMIESVVGTSLNLQALSASAIVGTWPSVNPNSAGIGQQNFSRSTRFAHSLNKFKVQFRAQFDSDGLTYWIWINDALPTVIGFDPPFGTKHATTVNPTFWTNGRRSWQLFVWPTQASTMPNLAVFNRIEVREWNHTLVSMPMPDSPF